MKYIIVLIISTFIFVSCRSRQTPLELKGANIKGRLTYKAIRSSLTSFITMPGEFIPLKKLSSFQK